MAEHDARTRAYDFGGSDSDLNATDEQPTTALPRTTPSAGSPYSTLDTGGSDATRVIPQQAPPPAPPAAQGRTASAQAAPRAGSQERPAPSLGHGQARGTASPSVWARIGSVFLAVPLAVVCFAAFGAIPALIVVSGVSTSVSGIVGGDAVVSPVWTMLVTMLAAAGFFLIALTMRLSGTGAVVAGALSVLAGLGCFIMHAQATAALTAAPIWQAELASFQLFAGPASGMIVSLLAAEAVVFGAALLGAGAAVSSARRHGWRKAVGF